MYVELNKHIYRKFNKQTKTHKNLVSRRLRPTALAVMYYVMHEHTDEDV